jgi:hypothetical protein
MGRDVTGVVLAGKLGAAPRAATQPARALRVYPEQFYRAFVNLPAGS